ncbi:MAG: phage minor head protein [Firmicutes bacterium]|nr:phage minor head protein [Bacillota bacterium]
MPINQQLMVEAVATNSKISTTLYKKLGQIIPQLKKRISIEVSRGISSNLSYHEIARNLDGVAKIGYNHALTIAQTEGHRIQTAAQIDACHAAKEKGADIVKQWDSTLDSRTRESHRKADGQIRELDEDFEVGGYHGSAPGHIGVAKEDIKCRCSLLQRARSALDEDELKTLQERAEYFGLDKTKNLDDFKKKYLKAVENSAESGIIKTSEKFDIPPDKINKFFLKPGAKHAQEFFDVGYSVDDYERLFDDIESEFDESKMVDVNNKPNGVIDFSVFMYLGVENKKRFRTVWRKDTPESKPRIITGHRED